MDKRGLFGKAARTLRSAGTTRGYREGWGFILQVGRKLTKCGSDKQMAVEAVVAYYRVHKWDDSILTAPKVGKSPPATPATQNKTWKEQAAEFYASREWQALRYEALKINGGSCQLCGRSRKDGVILHVDHIFPRWTHPNLSLVLSNLQVLCADCNLGKGAKHSDDWR